MRNVKFGIKPPHPKQQEILSYVMKPDPGVTKRVDVMCGRGFGKSIFSIDFATRVLSSSPKHHILFLEPDAHRMESVFLTLWNNIVPHEMFHINRKMRRITWRNGAILDYSHRDVRNNIDRRIKMHKGKNLTGVIDDEAADGFLAEQQQDIFNCIRVGGVDIWFYLTISTPIVGPYGRYVTQPGHKLFTGSSFDNKYLLPGTVEGWMKEMSRDRIRREIYGELIALEGRIFKDARVDLNDLLHQWPDGNVHYAHDSFRKGQPWWLFADLGSATGAYVAVQREPAPPGYGGSIWIAVADFCPQTDASASRALQRLDMEFGPPVEVVAGHDVKTRSAADGTTVAMMVNRIWGNIPVHPVMELRTNKQAQYDSLSSLICSSMDHRRFCVAKNFKSLDPDSHRGVIECLQEYEHRPVEQRRDGEFLPKGADQPLCHIADALMMGAVQRMNPPRALKTKEHVKM